MQVGSSVAATRVALWPYLRLNGNFISGGASIKGSVSTDIDNMEYGHEAEEYIFLNLPFPSNPMENSSIHCILSTPKQNLPRRVIGCTPNI